MRVETLHIQNPLDIEAIRDRLSTQTVGGRIALYQEIPSTNAALRDLTRAGAPEGTVVVAEGQTAGRGRAGKPWFSPPGVNLYASVLFRPAISPRAAQVFSFIASLALTDAIRGLGLWAGIKWPNDILVNRKKVAGMLAELATLGDRVEYVILGVGVNLNVEREALLGALGEAGRWATSLREALGRPIDRNAFAAEYLNALDRWLAVFEEQGEAALLRAWADRDILTGRRVEVREEGGSLDGRVVGVDPEGHLQVADSLGGVHRVVAGEVRVVE